VHEELTHLSQRARAEVQGYLTSAMTLQVRACLLEIL